MVPQFLALCGLHCQPVAARARLGINVSWKFEVGRLVHRWGKGRGYKYGSHGICHTGQELSMPEGLKMQKL